MELINPEQAALIVKEQVNRYENKILVIGPPGSVRTLSRIVDVAPKNFHWVSGPEDMKGYHKPIVVIMPNWWQHDYSGMEEMLNEVDAQIFNVYYGRKPNWKNPPQSLGDLPEYPATPDDALPPKSGSGKETEP